MIALDTHILIYALNGQSLTPAEQRALTEEPWSISAIVLWELAMLVRKKRIRLDLRASATRQALAQLHVWPITLDIALATTSLDFASDPADEMIAATSIVEGVPLLTRDTRIQSSKLVPFA